MRMLFRRYIKKLYNIVPLKKQLYLVLRRLNIPHSLYQHLHFRGLFEVKTPHSKFIIQHDGNRIENEIFWNGLLGGWEKESLKLWIKLVQTSKTILDIGSNTGIYSLVAKSISPNSNVIAFEPIRNIYNKLLYNIKINSFDIDTFNIAISDSDGEDVIFVPEGEHSYSASFDQNFIDGSKPVKVIKSTLDKIQSDKRIEIDLLKIDVENHELSVFNGMLNILKISKPTIIIEILNNNNAKSIETLLNNLDYLYFDIGKRKITQIEKLAESSDFNILICQEKIAKTIDLI
jgi:FkbM family methyltransferase